MISNPTAGQPKKLSVLQNQCLKIAAPNRYYCVSWPDLTARVHNAAGTCCCYGNKSTLPELHATASGKVFKQKLKFFAFGSIFQNTQEVKENAF